ncbi:Nuclear transport factor [Trichinella pseudospiralis]
MYIKSFNEPLQAAVSHHYEKTGSFTVNVVYQLLVHCSFRTSTDLVLSLVSPVLLVILATSSMHFQAVGFTKTVDMDKTSEELPLNVSAVVAKEFLTEYNDLLVNGGKSLYRLYSIDAQLIYNSEKLSGIDEIRKHIVESKFRSGVEKVAIRSFHTEVLPSQTLMIQAMGTLKIKEKQGERMFTQILTIQSKSETSYYIRNEMLSIVDMENESGITNKEIVIKKEMPQNTDGCEISQKQKSGIVNCDAAEKHNCALRIDKQSVSVEINDDSSTTLSKKKTDRNLVDDESQITSEWKFDDLSEDESRRLKMNQLFDLKNNDGDEKNSHEEKNRSCNEEKLSDPKTERNNETKPNTWAEVVRNGKSMGGSVAHERPNNNVTTMKSRRETNTYQSRKVILKDLPISTRRRDLIVRFRVFGFIDDISIRIEFSPEKNLKTKSALITFRDITAANLLLSIDKLQTHNAILAFCYFRRIDHFIITHLMELFLTAQRSSKEYRLTNISDDIDFSYIYKSISMEKSKNRSKKRCFGFICFLFMAMSVVFMNEKYSILVKFQEVVIAETLLALIENCFITSLFMGNGEEASWKICS